MRVRLFGQYVHVPIAALAAIEAVIFYGSLVLAYWVRFQTLAPQPWLGGSSSLWLCAGVFSLINLVSLLALGL